MHHQVKNAQEGGGKGGGLFLLIFVDNRGGGGDGLSVKYLADGRSWLAGGG
jgi:hypothetical protein